MTDTNQGKMKKPLKIGFLLLSIGVLAVAAFDIYSIIHGGISTYSVGGTYGFIDKSGNEVVKIQYDGANSFSDGMAVVAVGDEDEDVSYGYIDKTGKLVIDTKYEYASDFSEGAAMVSMNPYSGQFSCIDKTGQTLFDIECYCPYSFSEGMAKVEMGAIDDTRHGFVDKNGHMLFPQFEEASDFHEGLAAVSIDNHYGYIDKTGQVVIEMQFAYASDFSEGLAAVKVGDDDDAKYGYIDKTGQMVIAPQFAEASAFSQGLAAVSLNDDEYEEYSEFGYIDKTGQIVIEPQFSFAAKFSEDLAAVQLDYEDGYGFIDRSGNMIISPQYSAYEDFKEGLASVYCDSLQGYVFIDKTGEIVLGKALIDAGLVTYDYSEGLSRAYRKQRIGLKNWLGVHITEPIYKEFYMLDNGILRAKIAEDNCQLLNRRGKVLMDKVEWAYDFNEKLTEVVIEGKHGLVDKQGNFVVEPIYDGTGYYDSDVDRMLVKIDDKYGYINGKGEVAIDLIYDDANDFDEDGEALVELDGKSMYIDANGEIVGGNTSSSLKSMEGYIENYIEVEYADDNMLAPTPAEIEELVVSTKVDIRNSIYQILAQLPDYEEQYEYDKESKEEFITWNIIDNMVSDPAIFNVRKKDYKDCVKSATQDEMEDEDFSCWSLMNWWGSTWRSRFITPLLSSERLQNTMYEWVKPILKHAFDECQLHQKMFIVDAINHMLAYTSKYDHQTEKEFYMACCDSEYGEDLFNCTEELYDMEPEFGTVGNPYRPLETWVYRRVEEQSMSAEQIHYWLVRIKADLDLAGFQE